MQTHGPHRLSPRKALREFSSRSITLTNKSNCLTYTVASSLVCTSPLAVITVVGLLDVLMVSNSAELRSFLLTVCVLAPESTTNSLSSGSFVDAARSTHSCARKQNAALSFSLSLYTFFWQGSMLCFGHIAAVVQSLRGTCPQISQRGDFADEEPTMVLFFPGYSHDVAWTS